MCKLCDEGNPQTHSSSRRDFQKATAATGVAAAGVDLFRPRPAAAHDSDSDVPEDTGRRGRRYGIRGGSVMKIGPSKPNKGDWVQADVVVEGKKIVVVGGGLYPGVAARSGASGKDSR